MILHFAEGVSRPEHALTCAPLTEQGVQPMDALARSENTHELQRV